MGMIVKMGKGGYTCRKEEKEVAELDEKSDEFIVSFMHCFMIASLALGYIFRYWHCFTVFLPCHYPG